jgi:hypothetical protein
MTIGRRDVNFAGFDRFAILSVVAGKFGATANDAGQIALGHCCNVHDDKKRGGGIAREIGEQIRQGFHPAAEHPTTTMSCPSPSPMQELCGQIIETQERQNLFGADFAPA